MSEVHEVGPYIYAKSTLKERLRPGESTEHALSFTALLAIEFTLSLTAGCPAAGLASYDGDAGPTPTWTADIPVGPGRRGPSTVTNTLTLSDQLQARSTTDGQLVAVSTSVRSGEGPRKDDVALEHPFKITW